MILHRKNRQLPVAHSLAGLVVQVPMGDLNLTARNRFRIHGEAVVLSGDLHSPRLEVHHRMVCPMVAEFQLVGFSSQGQTQNLMAQTNTEDGQFPDALANRGDEIRHSFRVSGPVGDKQPVRLHRKDFRGSYRGRHDDDLGARLSQHSRNMRLHAAIHRHNFKASGGTPFRSLTLRLRPWISPSAGHFFDQVPADQTRRGLGLLEMPSGFSSIDFWIGRLRQGLGNFPRPDKRDEAPEGASDFPLPRK